MISDCQERPVRIRLVCGGSVSDLGLSRLTGMFNLEAGSLCCSRSDFTSNPRR